MCKRIFLQKICTLGIFLVCGFLLISVDDCETMYLEELKMAQSQASGGQGFTVPAAPTSSVASTPAAPASPVAASSVTGSPAASNPPTAFGAPSSSQVPPQAAAPQSAQGGTNPPGDAGSPAKTVPVQGTPSQSGQGADSTGADYLKTIIGKEWKLVELRLSDKTILLDRKKLSSEGAGDFFTMKIDKTRLSGKAAPNRYNTAYRAGPDNSLTLLPVITTLMATSYDPERLQEREYYQYLEKVKSWKLNQKKLELYTTDANNMDAVLIYSN